MAQPVSNPRIQHVSVPRPPGNHDVVRRFYTDLLGLQEVQPPQSLQHLDLIWYRLGETELHLFASDPVTQGLGAHFCIQVDDLQSLRATLEAGGADVLEDVAIKNRPRFFTQDPFGNRIEVTSIQGAYD